MVRPILVKMRKSQADEEVPETSEPDDVQKETEKQPETAVTKPEESSKNRSVTPLEKKTKKLLSGLNENDVDEKPMIIPQSDDETLKSRNLAAPAIEPVKSSPDVDNKSKGRQESETGPMLASMQKKSEERLRSPLVINESQSSDTKKAHTAAPSHARGGFAATTEEEKRALLREYAQNYDVGPRVVSEPVLAMRETTNSMIPGSNLARLPDNNALARMRNNFGSALAIHQSPQLNGLDLSSRGMNHWGPHSSHEINPMVLNAYMKTMQAQQTLRQNQALLQHDRRVMLNQALSQQHAMTHGIHGPGVNHNTNAALGPFFMDRGVLDRGFHTYSTPLPSKEDLNKNAVSALDYIAKMGKNKRGRPKRNPAEGWPKRPLSAYNIFFKECREKIVGEDSDKPESSDGKNEAGGDALKPHSRRKRRKKHGKISFGGLAKSVGSMWKELSSESMAYYERKAEESREAYRKEIKIFLEKRNKAFAEKRNSNDAE